MLIFKIYLYQSKNPAIRRKLILFILSGITVLLSSCAISDTANLCKPSFPAQSSLEKVSCKINNNAKQISPIKEKIANAINKDSLILGIREASLLALQQNPSFEIERLNPTISQTVEDQQRAAFDPILSAEVLVTRTKDNNKSSTAGISSSLDSQVDTRTGKIGLTQTLPTGTTIGISQNRILNNTFGSPSNSKNYNDLSATNTYDLTITQSLLKGFGPKVNLAHLRQAKLDTHISRHVLNAAAENLIYQTESVGWDYLLAQKQIAIYEESLKVTQKQLIEVKERIKVGSLANIELAAIKAEVAKRKEDLIDARSTLAKTRLEFFRLLGLGEFNNWQCKLTLTDTPEVPKDILAPIEHHVEVALKKRPDLAEARLRIKSGKLEIVRTKNGLLPRLDFFITIGGSRYAKSFGSSNTDQEDDNRNLEMGLQFEYALGRRSEQAAYSSSLLSLSKLKAALRNQEELAQVDVRTAYLDVKRTAEQIHATSATRTHLEEAFYGETEKFRVGKSTSILVAKAQRDLVASRIAEVQAVIGHLKARLNLFLQEGSLLERRGISAEQ